jgi:FMN phosphatase YigB (HAD superfamily)
MVGSAITFDFHNTLIHCDPWFELEVRTLPSAFLGWFWQEYGCAPDGQLARAADTAYRRLRRSIIAHGHELAAERALLSVFRSLDIPIDDAAIVEGVHLLMFQSLLSAQPVSGAVETVRSLSSRGITLGVVSSAVFHPFLEWSLARFGMREHFNVVVTSASAGYYKSRPEIYWSALTSLCAAPSASLHVGDSARFDVEGARRAGMRTAWLSTDSLLTPPQAQPDLVLKTLVGSAPALLGLFTASVQ